MKEPGGYFLAEEEGFFVGLIYAPNQAWKRISRNQGGVNQKRPALSLRHKYACDVNVTQSA